MTVYIQDYGIPLYSGDFRNGLEVQRKCTEGTDDVFIRRYKQVPPRRNAGHKAHFLLYGSKNIYRIRTWKETTCNIGLKIASVALAVICLWQLLDTESVFKKRHPRISLALGATAGLGSYLAKKMITWFPPRVYCEDKGNYEFMKGRFERAFPECRY